MESEYFNVVTAQRKTPWELGLSWEEGQKPTDQFATAAEMLEAAGLAGWDVQKKEMYVGRKGPKVVGKFATVATGGAIAGKVLGVVGRSYQVHQMEEAFRFGDNIVDDGQAKWERAGVFRGGSQAFGCMELAHLDISVPGDDSPIKPYLLIVNSFDGSSPVLGVLAYIRPVCVNTFMAAKGTATSYRFAIRHVGSLDGRILQAREAIGIAFKHTEEVKQLVTRLATASIVDEQVREIFSKKVWPISDDVPEGRLEAHLSTRAFENYLTSPTLEGIRGTKWGALNAVTEFVDHIADYKGRKVNDADSVKGNSILFGQGQMRAERALAALLKS
jgi:phage/plasmid-like protein (TIGR03299 family)